MNYKEKKERKRVQLKEEEQQKKDQNKEVVYERDERVIAILERLKKGETLAEIATIMCLDLSQVQNPYYSSELPEVVNYRAKKKLKKKCKRVQV